MDPNEQKDPNAPREVIFTSGALIGDGKKAGIGDKVPLKGTDAALCVASGRAIYADDPDAKVIVKRAKTERATRAVKRSPGGEGAPVTSGPAFDKAVADAVAAALPEAVAAAVPEAVEAALAKMEEGAGGEGGGATA